MYVEYNISAVIYLSWTSGRHLSILLQWTYDRWTSHQNLWISVPEIYTALPKKAVTWLKFIESVYFPVPSLWCTHCVDGGIVWFSFLPQVVEGNKNKSSMGCYSMFLVNFCKLQHCSWLSLTINNKKEAEIKANSNTCTN